ncbi:hypothetical protein [Bacillus halotolerans]|uniref:hypothetical protein n=1 Tax=Bacillus halotolerans TaxID=260554 RepID=UPI0020C32C63|nr:hypothetical protein [Bacillus halotolerans]UTL72690.1 hypothetical protein NLV76_20550 [Bacillus halotolerans]
MYGTNETKQPITDKLSAIGCVLSPVSKKGGSPDPESGYYVKKEREKLWLSGFVYTLKHY